jgi:hypothetical protein
MIASRGASLRQFVAVPASAMGLGYEKNTGRHDDDRTDLSDLVRFNGGSSQRRECAGAVNSLKGVICHGQCEREVGAAVNTFVVGFDTSATVLQDRTANRQPRSDLSRS